MENEKDLYEIGYLLKSSISEEDVLAFSEKLREEINKKNGLILSEGKTERLTLAYPIEKDAFAIFNWIKFSINPEAIKEMESFMKSNSDVVRFLTIKIKKEDTIKPIVKTRRAHPRPSLTTIPAKENKNKSIDEPVAETIKDSHLQEKEIDKKIEELLG